MFQQTVTEEFGKSLISWNILKITGRIFKNFYVPEYAENENRQSSSQSYPQKWTLCRKAPSFTDNQPLWYRKTGKDFSCCPSYKPPAGPSGP
jgi:hypothetical protein